MNDEKSEITASGGEPPETPPAQQPEPYPDHPLEKEISAAFGAPLAARLNFGELELKLRPEQLIPVCSFLKSHPRTPFNYLRNLTAVDYKDRFEIVCHLCALSTMDNLIIKVELERENPAVPSLCSVWSAADWQEREVFDLFGITFTGHPDLRRILLPDEWEGHPLRKDYTIEEKKVENWKEALKHRN
ncbi:MAG: NADH-quinone oxidoreductase subunit C [bacterium]